MTECKTATKPNLSNSNWTSMDFYKHNVSPTLGRKNLLGFQNLNEGKVLVEFVPEIRQLANAFDIELKDDIVRGTTAAMKQATWCTQMLRDLNDNVGVWYRCYNSLRKGSLDFLQVYANDRRFQEMCVPLLSYYKAPYSMRWFDFLHRKFTNLAIELDTSDREAKFAELQRKEFNGTITDLETKEMETLEYTLNTLDKSCYFKRNTFSALSYCIEPFAKQESAIYTLAANKFFTNSQKSA